MGQAQKKLQWYETLIFRLYRAVLGLFFAVATVVTSVQLFLEYRDAETRTLLDVEKFYKANANSLSEALWTFDDKLLDKILQGMIQVDFVQNLTVFNDKGEVIKAMGNYQTTGSRVYPFPVVFIDQQKRNWEMGRIEFVLNPQAFLKTVAHGFFLILSNYLISFLIFFLIFTFAGSRILGRPLNALTKAVADIDLGNLGLKPLDLKISGRNEISLLQDTFNQMLGNLRSALDQKSESDKKVHLLLEYAPLGMGLTDLQGRLLLINPQISQLFGFTQNELLGKEVQNLWLGKTFNFPLTHRIQGLECTGIRKDGTSFPLEISVAPLEEEKKTHSVTFRDLSMVKQSEKLQEEKDNAIKATEAKSQFLANMSHEIRTPLNAVLGLTHLVLKTDLAEDQRSYINQIESSAQTLLSIVSDILDFSKIEAGKMNLENHPFSLKDILKSLDSMLRYNAEIKKLSFNINLDPSLPEILMGDSLRLNQILINLAANALKFTEQGGIEIVLKKISQGPQDVEIFFSVQDTGIGISPEQKKKIFESFSQGDDSTTRKFGGTGLGLAIASRLVRMMGGHLEVTSQLNSGSDFYFTLKLPQGEVFQIPTARKKAIDLQGFNILIVEDNPVNRLVLREILRKSGASVLEAENGFDAVELVFSSASVIDLILMDLQMPKMDGFEATRELRSRGWSGPIIAVTANAFNQERQKCLEIGMQDHLSKPIKPELLLEQIQFWLESTKTESSSQIFLQKAFVTFDPGKLQTSMPEKTFQLIKGFADRYGSFREEVENLLRAGNLTAIIHLLRQLLISAETIGALELPKIINQVLDQLVMGQPVALDSWDDLYKAVNLLVQEIQKA